MRFLRHSALALLLLCLVFPSLACAQGADGGADVSVSFRSMPQGAAVLVDGQMVCMATPCTRDVAPGMHLVAMSAEGFLTSELQLEIVAGATYELALQARPGEGPEEELDDDKPIDPGADAAPPGDKPPVERVNPGIAPQSEPPPLPPSDDSGDPQLEGVGDKPAANALEQSSEEEGFEDDGSEAKPVVEAGAGEGVENDAVAPDDAEEPFAADDEPDESNDAAVVEEDGEDPELPPGPAPSPVPPPPEEEVEHTEVHPDAGEAVAEDVGPRNAREHRLQIAATVGMQQRSGSAGVPRPSLSIGGEIGVRIWRRLGLVLAVDTLQTEELLGPVALDTSTWSWIALVEGASPGLIRAYARLGGGVQLSSSRYRGLTVGAEALPNGSRLVGGVFRAEIGVRLQLSRFRFQAALGLDSRGVELLDPRFVVGAALAF